MNVLAVTKSSRLRYSAKHADTSHVSRNSPDYLVAKHPAARYAALNNRRYNVAKHLYGVFPNAGSIPSNALLNEDGTPILNEDGSYILVE